jgi:hypothetical protein
MGPPPRPSRRLAGVPCWSWVPSHCPYGPHGRTASIRVRMKPLAIPRHSRPETIKLSNGREDRLAARSQVLDQGFHRWRCDAWCSSRRKPANFSRQFVLQRLLQNVPHKTTTGKKYRQVTPEYFSNCCTTHAPNQQHLLGPSEPAFYPNFLPKLLMVRCLWEGTPERRSSNCRSPADNRGDLGGPRQRIGATAVGIKTRLFRFASGPTGPVRLRSAAMGSAAPRIRRTPRLSW